MTKVLFATLAILVATCSQALPRDAAQKHAFRKQNPCPSTGTIRGACPGWQIDHTRALMNGGKDRPSNMQWLAHEHHKAKTKTDITTCKSSYSCKHKRLAKKLPFQKSKKRR